MQYTFRRWAKGGQVSATLGVIALLLVAVSAWGQNYPVPAWAERGERIKYDFSGQFGFDNIADSASAYVDGKLVAKATAKKILKEGSPYKLEVEIEHYSDAGQVTYRGIALYRLGAVYKPKRGPKLQETSIAGHKVQDFFQTWPVPN